MRVHNSYPTALAGPNFYILPREEGSAKRLVLFFGAKDLRDASFNFFQSGRELPEHVAFFNNGANEWYQYGIPGLADNFEDCVQLLRDWAACLAVEEICCIGTSMGGWGAIRYGAALGARVLAFSSDVTLNDPVSRSYKLFNSIGPVVPCPDLREALVGSKVRIRLIVGERDATDLHAAALLAEAPQVEAISIVGCGHIVPSHLSSDARLGPLLRDFVADRPFVSLWDEGRALGNAAYIEAIYEAQKAWVAGDWATVVHQAEIGLKHLPYGEAAELLLGRARIKLADFQGAIAPLTSASVTAPARDPEALVLLAMAWKNVGAHDRSAQLSKAILRHNPGESRAHYNLALIAKRQADLKSAHLHARAALRREPGNRAYRAFLLGLPDP